MRTLYIAEKPSVGREIARILGATQKQRGYLESKDAVVSWCFGHLAGIAPNPAHYSPRFKTWTSDDLPILPDTLNIVATGDAKQLGVLKKLLNAKDINVVVNACDAAREGEAIFRNVYELSGSSKPIKRLWIASMTDAAIRAGLKNLKDGADYRGLADAARSREESDWLVGINATRALTLKARSAGANELYSVGRVQTPTLAMIVARDKAISQFVSEPYWEVHAEFTTPDGDFSAVYTPERGARFNDIVRAQALLASLIDIPKGHVQQLDEQQRRSKPPLLYDLTTLQREANKRHGFSAKSTLDIAQALYEKHKLLTYPRTDSAYITNDMVPTLMGRVEASRGGAWVRASDRVIALRPAFQTRVVNNNKVTDHHAILPTETTPNLDQLSKDELAIYEMVVRRMLASYFDDVLQTHTTGTIALSSHPFVAKGVRIDNEGWWFAEPPHNPKAAQDLPKLRINQPVNKVGLEVVEKQTRPPKSFTEASLLGAMEIAGKELDDEELRQAIKGQGIGTPATRASIIELLLKRKYIVRKKKTLCATDLGHQLIDALEDPTLKSAELTGKWEHALSLVAQGAMDRTAYMAKIRAFTKQITTNIGASTPTIRVPEKKTLGTCPLCAKDVFETRKVYTCESGRACDFVIFKTIAKKTISASAVKTLLKGETTKPLKGFTSKKGKSFSAALTLDEQAKVKFVFEDRK